MALAVVAVKTIETLLDGIAVRMRPAEAPFTKRAGHITLRLQQLAHRYLFGWYGVLPLGFEFLVVAHKGVTGMFAGHQYTPRRCAHGVAGIVRRKPHAFARKLVEVWRLDFLLSVGAQLRPAEVIGHDENDVGLIRQQRGHENKQAQKK